MGDCYNQSAKYQGIINFLGMSPIQVVNELNIAWLQWSYENWYFQVDKPLRPAALFIVNIGGSPLPPEF